MNYIKRPWFGARELRIVAVLAFIAVWVYILTFLVPALSSPLDYGHSKLSVVQYSLPTITEDFEPQTTAGAWVLQGGVQ